MTNFLQLLGIDFEDLLSRREMRALLHTLLDDEFYVYSIWRMDLEHPVPFYIGKGHGNRAVYHSYPSGQRNNLKRGIFGKSEIRYSIVQAGLPEDKAIALERDLIALIGRTCLGTGPLANIRAGGDNGSECKAYGPHHGRSRAVVAEGKTYAMMSEAAKALGVNISAIHKRINFGWPGYYYVDTGQAQRRRPPKHSEDHIAAMRQNTVNKSKAVEVDGQTFRSLSAAANFLSVNYATVRNRCRSERHPNYCFID